MPVSCTRRELAALIMKMKLLDVAGGKYGWLFSLELLLLVIANIPLAYGQQGNTAMMAKPHLARDHLDSLLISLFFHIHTDGVSLKMLGVVAPNNSLVDRDDILYTTADSQNPSNTRPGQHDESLLCVTDLVDCCETPMLGNWYLPDGTPVGNTGNGVFHSNRGQNEVRNGRQFYGSVRLFRRYTPSIPDSPIYRCELPDRFNVMQTLYAYIGEFITQLV